MSRLDELQRLWNKQTDMLNQLSQRMSDAESYYGSALIAFGAIGVFAAFGQSDAARYTAESAVKHLRLAAAEYTAIAAQLESVRLVEWTNDKPAC